MRILRLCKDMFNATPDGHSVKEFFQEMREKELEERDDREIFSWWSGYLGGRGYNEFLDYSLFAIKLNHIFNKYWTPGVDNRWERMRTAILNLLGDDRHDMYQNIPYELDDVAKTYEPEVQLDFWQDVVDAMIECINVEGTGDLAHTFTIKEV